MRHALSILLVLVTFSVHAADLSSPTAHREAETAKAHRG